MDIDHVQFPLLLPASPVKRAAKVALGALLAPLFATRIEQLYAGDVGPQLSSLDRLLVAPLVHRHEQGGSLDRLAPLQRWIWACDQAVAFHAQAEARFERWWRQGVSRIVEPLQRVIDAAPNGYAQLCEIGCGSGLVLEDLSRTVRGVDGFLGLDLSPKQIAHNTERFAGTVLRFAAGDATAWIPAHAAPGWIYLTNAGVLEYLTEAQLVALFTHVASGLGPAAFALAEPIAADYDLTTETRSRAFGPERTFSHNYVDLLRRCGWTVQFTDVEWIEATRLLLVVATAPR